MRSERLAFWGGLGALLALFLTAYRSVAALWPWGRDAERWLERGDPASPEWATWVFFTRHFVGYRPVAALSYAVDALWLPTPHASNAVDLLGSAAVIALVAVVGRALVARHTSPRRATAAGLFAAALVAFHPVMQEIAPFTARRSYVLAEGLGLAALGCLLAGLRRAPGTWLLGGWGLPAAALLGLACGSNEAIFPLACLFPVLAIEGALAAGQPGSRGLRAAVLPLVPVVFLAIARNFVLPDDNRTGYVNKWFAYADGQLRLRALDAPEPLNVFTAAWSYALFPSSPSGDVPLLAGGLAGAALLVAGWLLVRGVAEPIASFSEPVRRLPLWLLGWAGITASLYAVANTWFWREGFPLLVPLALALAAIAAADLERTRSVGRQVSTLAALIGIALSALWYSPLFGLDRSPLNEEVRATRILDRVVEARARLPRPSMVWIVPVGDRDFARDIQRVAMLRLAGSGIVLRVLATVPRHSDDAATAQVSDGVVRIAQTGRFDDRSARLLGVAPGSREVGLARLAAGSRVPGEIWWWEGVHMRGFRSAPLPPPSPIPPRPLLP